ncbi:lipase member H-A-like [Chironomus tepperi]|uniref:lipase member H-A-like n=1 Tax=Chironomus tepperi TaxID=113505 RepID=UPI00391F4DCA
MVFKYPKYYTEFFAIEDFENVKLHPAFNFNKSTVLYIHGFRESVLADSVQTVVSAYLSRNDHNIFALDWSNYSSGSYVAHAVPSVIGLGNLIGYRMNSWLEQGILDEKRLHIVGHSLGGQMSGYIGKMVNLLSSGTRKIHRITALDPAKPLFYTNRTAMISYIHMNDAELVDIIHTNAGVLGSSVSVGNCDFWPNGGSFQPGCAVNSIINCDHKRSWMYYAESVASMEPKFNAIVCEDYKNFKKLNCSDNLTSFMGFYASENCSGVYYLQTNNDFPYSRGVFGLLYSPLVDIDRQNVP